MCGYDVSVSTRSMIDLLLLIRRVFSKTAARLIQIDRLREISVCMQYAVCSPPGAFLATTAALDAMQTVQLQQLYPPLVPLAPILSLARISSGPIDASATGCQVRAAPKRFVPFHSLQITIHYLYAIPQWHTPVLLVHSPASSHGRGGTTPPWPMLPSASPPASSGPLFWARDLSICATSRKKPHEADMRPPQQPKSSRSTSYGPSYSSTAVAPDY